MSEMCFFLPGGVTWHWKKQLFEDVAPIKQYVKVVIFHSHVSFFGELSETWRFSVAMLVFKGVSCSFFFRFNHFKGFGVSNWTYDFQWWFRHVSKSREKEIDRYLIFKMFHQAYLEVIFHFLKGPRVFPSNFSVCERTVSHDHKIGWPSDSPVEVGYFDPKRIITIQTLETPQEVWIPGSLGCFDAIPPSLQSKKAGTPWTQRPPKMGRYTDILKSCRPMHVQLKHMFVGNEGVLFVRSFKVT